VKLLIGCEKGKTLVLDIHSHFLTENEIENARLFDASIFDAYFMDKMQCTRQITVTYFFIVYVKHKYG